MANKINKRQLSTRIGRRVRQLRLEQDMSMKKFEAVAEFMDRHSLSKIELGSRMPSLITLLKLCRVFGVSLQDFFNGMRELE